MNHWHYSCPPARCAPIDAQLYSFTTRQMKVITVLVKLKSSFVSQPLPLALSSRRLLRIHQSIFFSTSQSFLQIGDLLNFF